jgi:glycosyltransferase involved in cell wall biosynthesis
MKNKSIPLFSICIVTFNQANLIQECINSVLNQDYENIEIVVCDDESCDFNIDNITEYINNNKKSNIKNAVIFKQKQNVGTTLNCQKAVELSHGEIFKLQAGDDLLFDENVISKMVKKFENNEEINIIATRARGYTHEGKILEDIYPPEQAFEKFMNAQTPSEQFSLIGTEPWGMYICAPTVFWRRSFFNVIGGFNLKYKYLEDWPMWLKICNGNYLINNLDETTVLYRYGGISSSRNGLNSNLNKLYALECIDMLKSIVVPVLEKRGTKYEKFKCWHSYNCIMLRRIFESDWTAWGIGKRLKFKIENLKYFLLLTLYRRINQSKYFSLKKYLLLCALLGFMIFFNVNIYTEWNNKYILSFLLLISLSISVLRSLVNIIIFIANKILINNINK